MTAPRPSLDELAIADDPAAWSAAGFHVEGDLCVAGGVRLRLDGPRRRRGIVSWSVRDLVSLELDGLPTEHSERPPAAAPPHPNGAESIDHLVVITPLLERTVEALRSAGLDFRRLREGPTPGGSVRQAFFRMGGLILEVVEAPAGTRIASAPSGPAQLFGIAFLTRDIERTAAALGDRLGAPRDAVQPGRRIATVRRGAGFGPAVAFITPGPGAI